VVDLYPEHLDTPIDILIEGGRAAVLIHFQGKNSSGVAVDFTATDWFVFEDEKIKSLTILYDSLALSQALERG